MTSVLGIHDGHLATAALVVDGRLVACASEERFSRRKNQAGLPLNAIRFVLRHGQLEPNNLDLVVLAGKDLAPIGVQDQRNLRGIYTAISPIRRRWGSIEYHLRPTQHLGRLGYALYSRPGFYLTRGQRLRTLFKRVGIRPSQLKILEHHFCHAYAATYGPPWKGENYLVMTLDGEGDELCATVNIVEDGKLRRIASTPKRASLGWIYAEVTRYLGMKPLEHEYKVMGLAPYAQPEGVENTYKIMRRMITLSSSHPLVFESPLRTNLTYTFLRHNMNFHRFDWIAGAAQKLVEELILSWVSAAIRETGIRNIALSGGVFMNVKANLAVMELADVDKLFVFPNCGDESNAIASAWWGFSEITGGNAPVPLGDLYLGPEFCDEEIERILKAEGLPYEEIVDIEKVVAELISQNKVVARVNGRMEWGARALGNRSILANPSNWETVRIINTMIKQRDFWMPFAPTILPECEDEYLENSKHIPASYMIMAFRSKPVAQSHLTAAMHPYDFTLRPQVASEDWNPSYYEIINRFRDLTGIGGVLNTSFNLHGEPVVCSPLDAIHVLKNSGLEHLALGRYLITKTAAC